MSSTQLRTDATNGNPYTFESFKEVYGDSAQAIWDGSEVFDAATSPPVIRVAPPSPQGTLSSEEIAASVREVLENGLPSPSPVQTPPSPEDFPALVEPAVLHQVAGGERVAWGGASTGSL